MSPNPPLCFSPGPGVIAYSFVLAAAAGWTTASLTRKAAHACVRERLDQMLTLSTPPRRTSGILRSEKVVGSS